MTISPNAPTLYDISRDVQRLAIGSPGERELGKLAAQLKDPRNRAALAGTDLLHQYPPEIVLSEGPTWQRHLVSGLELVL